MASVAITRCIHRWLPFGLSGKAPTCYLITVGTSSTGCNVWAVTRARTAADNENIWFGVLLAIAGAARLYNFTHAPDDAHEWRQTQTLMYAASYSHGAGLLTPFSNWTGASPHPAVLEFPIYSILAYWLSGLVDLVAGARLVSLISSVAAVLVFDRLCLALDHPRRRTATLMFAFTPLAIFYGHATQPDSLLILLLVAAAYFSIRSEQSWWWAAGAAILLAAAATIKPTALVVIAPPLIYFAWRHGRWARQAMILIVASASVVAWGVFVRAVLVASDPAWYAANTDPDWVWGSLSLRISPLFYFVLLSRLLTILAPPLAALLIVVAARRHVGHPFWWWWTAGSVASLLIFANLNEIHLYYQLPFVPALAALAAYAAPSLPGRLPARLGLAAALVTAAVLGSLGLYHEQPIYFDAGTGLGSATSANPSHPVVVISSYGGTSWWPTVLFYAGRNGWNLPPGADSRRIASLNGPTPCWLVIVLDGPRQTLVPDGWSATTRTPEYVLARNLAC